MPSLRCHSASRAAWSAGVTERICMGPRTSNRSSLHPAGRSRLLRYAAAMNESDYLRLLTRQAEQATDFLSNARKWERERWVCQRLLNALNQRHRPEDFGNGGEPPDVLFREANFEVFFVLDKGRRLNDEWKEELQRRRSALSLSQLLRREPRPRRIAASELQARLGPTLRKKAHNYRERGVDPGELDLLAFIS